MNISVSPTAMRLFRSSSDDQTTQRQAVTPAQQDLEHQQALKAALATTQGKEPSTIPTRQEVTEALQSALRTSFDTLVLSPLDAVLDPLTRLGRWTVARLTISVPSIPEGVYSDILDQVTETARVASDSRDGRITPHSYLDAAETLDSRREGKALRPEAIAKQEAKQALQNAVNRLQQLNTDIDSILDTLQKGELSPEEVMKFRDALARSIQLTEAIQAAPQPALRSPHHKPASIPAVDESLASQHPFNTMSADRIASQNESQMRAFVQHLIDTDFIQGMNELSRYGAIPQHPTARQVEARISYALALIDQLGESYQLRDVINTMVAQHTPEEIETQGDRAKRELAPKDTARKIHIPDEILRQVDVSTLDELLNNPQELRKALAILEEQKQQQAAREREQAVTVKYDYQAAIQTPPVTPPLAAEPPAGSTAEQVEEVKNQLRAMREGRQEPTENLTTSRKEKVTGPTRRR